MLGQPLTSFDDLEPVLVSYKGSEMAGIIKGSPYLNRFNQNVYNVYIHDLDVEIPRVFYLISKVK
jgi:hypothetical protein